MKVTVAKTAGFCFGVKRSMDMVEEVLAAAKSPVYTYGPIIHNEEVVRSLAERGVTVVNNLEDLLACPSGTVLLRSHGIRKEEAEMLEDSEHTVVDCTCPFVKRIHKIVEQYAGDGYDVIIIGNREHPEVRGIKSYGKEGHVSVLETKEEAESCVISAQTLIVAQTTQNVTKFKDLVEIIQKKEYDGKGYGIVVINTICSATEERQREAAQIAENVDAMIVIGSRESSNTKKLYDICKEACDSTIYIQTIRDFNALTLNSCEKVGITAGASTPTNIIEEVQKHVRNEF